MAFDFNFDRDWLLVGGLDKTKGRDAAFDFICETYDVTRDTLIGRRRTRSIAEARHHLMWILRVVLGLSLPRIGSLLERDHTTIIHGVRKHAERMAGGAV